MTKITLENLAIELTRRCNMSCPHCMRGDAQNIDIDRSYIDALLEQTELIGQLFFAGGEPMLNLETMEYVADKLCENGIPLLGVDIITNGLIFSQEFTRIIKKYREIIDVSCSKSFKACLYIPSNETQRIRIGISLDKYHEQGEICRNNFRKYESSLSGCAVVIPTTIGNSPISVGRAKTLQESLPCSNFKKFEELRRIEIFDKDHIPDCKISNEYRLFRDDQKIICFPGDVLLKHFIQIAKQYFQSSCKEFRTARQQAEKPDGQA